MKYWKDISAFAIITIAVGALDKYLYYHAFNISFFDYVSLAETFILMDFFLPWMCASMLVGIFLVFIFAKDTKRLSEIWHNNDERIEFKKNNEQSSSGKTFVKAIKSEFEYLILAIVLTILYFIFSDSQPQSSIMLAFVYFCVFHFGLNVFYDLLIHKLEIIRLKHLTIRQDLSIRFIIIIIPIFILHNRMRVSNKLYSEENLITTLYLNDGNIIKSNNEFRYLGRSEDYLFFYDIDAHNAVIYKSENIKQIYIEETEN